MLIDALKRRIRSALWRLLGPPPPPSGTPQRSLRSWERPLDTLIGRDTAIDMAVMNVHIATRLERARADKAGTLLGDYAEFGVFEGRIFSHAFHRAAPLMPWMRFLAFDSFDGLPEPQGIDAQSEFWKGQFACTKERFVENIRAAGVDMTRVQVVDGWFDQTLTDELVQREKLECIAIAYIDCDLYESAIPVLAFLTKLVRQGSILLIDDWHHFRGDPNRGLQRAVTEWLEAHPTITLAPWYDFSHHGKAFMVVRQDHGEPGTAATRMHDAAHREMSR